MSNTNKYKNLNDYLFGAYPFGKIAPNLIILLARVYAGYTIMIAGLEKLPLPNWMIEQVLSMGFPFPTFFAWTASWVEFAFGCLLILGLISRFSASLLAIVFGVAAFAFHQVIPFGEMHITQVYFWLFLLLAISGAGKYSFDHFIFHSEMNFTQRLSYIGIPAILVLLAMGLFLERGEMKDLEETNAFKIESLGIAGNFNHWDPASMPMETKDSILYFKDIAFEKSSPIQFKFTANQSWSYNLGEIDQQEKGFPLKGRAELDQGANTKNIESYIPAKGIYRFSLNIKNYAYSIEATDQN